MHICVFSLRGISKHIPHSGGVHTHVKNLVTLLLDLGCEVSLITGEGEERIDERLAISVIPGNMGGRPSKNWSQKAGEVFLEIHHKNRVECIFSEGDTARRLMNTMAVLKIPVVAFVHNLSLHYFFNSWQEVDGIRAFKSYVFRTLPRILYDIPMKDIAFLRKCRRIVTGSSTIANHLPRFYRLPKNRIRVVHNWVDPENFRLDETAGNFFRKQQGISKNEIVFLFVGSLWRPKGFRVGLTSFCDVAEVIPNSRLLICGEGPDRKYFEDYIHQRPHLQGRVKLLGLCPHSKLSEILSAGDVFVIPSLLNEVLPYTLLEAMACELPIIATDIAANREAMGDTGYFVPRRDADALTQAMLLYASQLEERRSAGNRAKKRVLELFSYKMASKKIDRLLGDII